MDRRFMPPAAAPIAVVAAILLIGTGLFALPDHGIAQFGYTRNAVAAGQVWRLFSAHFVHLNAAHLFINAAAFVLIAALFAPVLSARALLTAVGVSAGTIGTALWYGSADVQWYVGLSGVLHALFAFGAFRWWHRARGWSAVLMGVLVIKLILESKMPPMGTPLDIPVVYVAHRYGAIAGISLGILSAAYAAVRQQKTIARASDRTRGASD